MTTAIYKGNSITILCCGESMQNLGPWPHRQTEILVTKFFCSRCRNSIDVVEPDHKAVWEAA